MNWATVHIERLQRGEVARFRPRGHSMTGLIEDGQQVLVEPLRDQCLAVDDVVLCRVRGRVFLHRIVAVQGERYLIGNNRGGINGWVGRRALYGVLVAVER